MPVPVRRLTLDQARRIALAAQGFAEPRPSGTVDRRHGRRLFDRVGVVQIDSVNVLCRTQELVLFARLGDHRRDLIPSMTEAGDVFEYWAHEASHVPVALHPFLRWRMDDAAEGQGMWGQVAKIRNDDPGLVARVLDRVREGACTIGMIEEGVHGQRLRRSGGMWGWNTTKVAAEYLFWSGQITARRGPNFERLYDLPERALAPEVLALPTPPPAEAKKKLLMVGARSHGVGAASDLVDYFRLNG
ncbi:MAG: crosslink repair DNA glycosylase YcaQ family protein, partial [Aquihabitans sp.]